MVGDEFAPGMIVYGVPVGTDMYIKLMLEKKVSEIKENAVKDVQLLENYKLDLWTVLRSSIQHQFGYWLMLVHPSLIQEAARKVDSIMWQVVEALLDACPSSDFGLASQFFLFSETYG